MIALTQSFDGERWALVAVEQRFEFDAEWGPILADMLNEAWPECPACEDRSCVFCDSCIGPGCNCSCQREEEEDEDDDPPILE